MGGWWSSWGPLKNELNEVKNLLQWASKKNGRIGLLCPVDWDHSRVVAIEHMVQSLIKRSQMYSSSGTMKKCIKTVFKAMVLKEREASAVVDSTENWTIVARQSHSAFDCRLLIAIEELCVQNALKRRLERTQGDSVLLGTMTGYSLERWPLTTFLEPTRMMPEIAKGRSKPSTVCHPSDSQINMVHKNQLGACYRRRSMGSIPGVSDPLSLKCGPLICISNN